jgi:uncharacterized membrane protein
MHSKTRFAGRAIHPMIVVFPIAFYTSTMATLLAYVGTQDAFWYRVAMIANIAGIITAALAVIPGAIDLLWMPFTSRARSASLKHAGGSALATGLFAATAFLLYDSWHHRVVVDGKYVIDATIPLAMSVVAWVSMMIAASLGWALVQTHHIGVSSPVHHADRPSPAPRLSPFHAQDTVVDPGNNLHSPAVPAVPAVKEAPPVSMPS